MLPAVMVIFPLAASIAGGNVVTVQHTNTHHINRTGVRYVVASPVSGNVTSLVSDCRRVDDVRAGGYVHVVCAIATAARSADPVPINRERACISVDHNVHINVVGSCDRDSTRSHIDTASRLINVVAIDSDITLSNGNSAHIDHVKACHTSARVDINVIGSRYRSNGNVVARCDLYATCGRSNCVRSLNILNRLNSHGPFRCRDSILKVNVVGRRSKRDVASVAVIVFAAFTSSPVASTLPAVTAPRRQSPRRSL